MTETLQAGSAASDAELITRVRAGDRAAYGVLYARHSTAALTLARQFSNSPAEADDLVSESFARVLDTLIAGGGPDAAFRAYLFTTLRNTAYDRTRKDKRLSFTDDVEAHDVAVDVDDPVVLQAENSLVGKAFTALPERWQAVLWYTQVDGMSPAEAGVLLGMSANAVTSLAYRAREGLREAYLQAHLADTAAERCRTTVDRLGAWARGGLSKREQAQVDSHLAECDRCRALAAELTEINSGIRGMIAPLLLGGAAVAYLAATVVAPPLALVSAGTFLGTQSAAGGVGASGAAAGSAGGAHAAGAAGLWSRPWVLAGVGGVVAVVGVVVAVVVALSGGSGPSGAAGGPAVTSGATASAAGQGGTGSGGSGTGTGGAGSTGTGSNGTASNGTGSSGPASNGTAPNGASGTDGATAPATGTGVNGTGTTGNSAGTTDAAGPPVIVPGGAGDGSPGDQGNGSSGDNGNGSAGGGSGGSGGSSGSGGSPGSSPALIPPPTPATSSAPQTASGGAPSSTTGARTPTGGGHTATTGAPPTTPTTRATSRTTPTTPTTPSGALLSVSLGVVVAPLAGGNGTVTFTVDNSGGTASAATRIGLGDTLGASIVGGTASQTPHASGLRRASLFEVLTTTAQDSGATTSAASAGATSTSNGQVGSAAGPAAQVGSAAGPAARVGSAAGAAPAAQAGAALLDCSTHPGSCTLGPIAPASVATVTLTIHVPATAASGLLVIDVGSDGLSLRTNELSFGDSLSSLTLDAGATLIAGTSTTANLTGTPGDGVSDPIDITIPRIDGDLVITAVPDTCRPATGGSDAVTCTPINDTTAEYGEFGIAIKASADGEQDLTATLPGGQEVPVYGPTGRPLDIAPIAPGSPISLTGGYAGTQVGAAALECTTAYLPRDLCAKLKAFQPVNRPQSLAVPEGATVVAATLTWAAAGPADGDPSSLDQVAFHLGDTSTAIIGATPPGVSDIDDTLYVRTADVTDLVTTGGSVWVDGIAARTTLTSTQPMAGWTLDVIWFDPSAAATTVTYGNPNTLSSSSEKGTTTPIATTGDDTTTFWVTLWAPDPWATKSVLAGGQPVKTDSIDGLVAELGANGGTGPHATGFNLLAGATDRPGQAIILFNVDGPAVKGFETSSRQDSLWIGPTLVIGQVSQKPPAA